jgi:hypothetical protein
MSNAYLYRMPAGIPGDVTRRETARIEAQIMDPTTPATVFGVPVKMVSGKIKPLAATGDTIYGLLCRPYPTTGLVAGEALGAGVPSIVMAANILKSGYMTVLVANFAAASSVKNAQVYFNNTTGLIEAYASGGAGQTAITGAYFMGVNDAAGNVEIVYNI